MNQKPFTQPLAPAATCRHPFPVSTFRFPLFALLLLALAASPSAIAQLYTLTYGAGNGGHIQTNYPQGAYDPGTLMTFNAIPDPGYSFRLWQATGSLVLNPTNAQIGFQITANTTLAAVFAPTPAPTPAPATHWKGQTNSNWSGQNWAGNVNGTITATTNTPNSNSNITLSATGAQNQTPITLDVDATIASLTVNDAVGLSGNKTLTVRNNISVGNGSLTLSNGVTLQTNGAGTNIGDQVDSNGTVTVNDGNLTLEGAFVGNYGTGSLVVDGGDASTQQLIVGSRSGSSGTVTVTSGSLTTGDILIGENGSGTLLVNGGKVTSNGQQTAIADQYSTGVATVTSGSWTIASDLNVGRVGTGTLNVTGTGTVSVGANGTGKVSLGFYAGSVGTLNIGEFGGSSTAGTLNAAEVNGGQGTAVINFNQTDAITFVPIITGSASVNQLGTGTTTLTGNSTYTGETKVSAGTLYINGDNSAATGAVTVSGGTLSGIGKIGGDITVQNGGTISPGSSTNINGSAYLLVNNLSLLSGSTALFDIAGKNTFDQIGSLSSNGTLSAAGIVTLSLQLAGGYTGAQGDTFRIIDFANFSFDISNFSVTSNLDTKFKWDLSGLKTAGEVAIALSIPSATHWLGQTGVNWSETNWASDAAGSPTTVTPTSADGITFSAAGAANQTDTVLDVDTTIKSLTVESSAGIKGVKTLTITGDTNVNAGTLTLSGGVTLLTGGKGTIDGAGDGAVVTVDGKGTTWAVTGDLVVGNNATGALNVTGGSVSSNTLIIGNNGGSSGTVTLSGGSIDAKFLTIGESGGTGALLVSGGVLTNPDAYITDYAGAGSATVSGGTWNNTGNLYVGGGGLGTLDITGGLVTTGVSARLGLGSSAEGRVTVSGTGAFQNVGDLIVGDAGTGTLDIKAGGTVTSLNGIIAAQDGSIGTVNVDGSGSKWTMTGNLTVDNGGTGELNITNGGEVSDMSGFISGSPNLKGTVTVDGTGSKWTNTGDVAIGVAGDGTLNIKAGGSVTSANGWVGSQIGSIGTVNVDGSGSKWAMTGNLTVDSGGTGELNITNGGEVSDTNAYISINEKLQSSVTVDGSGSKWTNSGSVSVGDTGPGALNIQNGGSVSVGGGSGTLTLGANAGGAGTLNIGSADTPGTAGTLNASEVFGGSGTAVVNFNQTDNIAFAPNITGRVALNQLGSGTTTLTGASTYTGGTVIDGGSLVVTGTVGSSNNTSTLYVGKTNGETNLTVSNGGVLTNGKTVIGDDAISSLNTVLITGAKSEWNSSVTFYLGYNGSGNQMTVSGGAAVSVSTPGGQNVDALIGANAGASNNSLTVTGEGSSFTNNATLYVGRSGTGNELDILEGGLVTSKNVRIGGGTGSNGVTEDSFALVNGAGSTWNISGTMRVGSSGSYSGLTISNGGAVNVTGNTFVGYDASSNGNSVLVWDAGSKWSLNALTIGRLGTNNVVTVAFDANLTASSITVGEQAGSSGTLQIAEKGVVSIDGGAGTLHLAQAADSAGTLNIGSGNKKISSASNGNKFTAGGTLDAAEVNGGAGTATINFNQTDNPYRFLPKITGSTSVNQNGPGTTVIQAENTYTGGTTVRNGVLQTINAFALGTGPVTVNRGILGVAGPLRGISSLAWAGGNIALSPGQGDMITTNGKFINSDSGGQFLIGTADLAQKTYTLVNFDATNFLLGDFSALFSDPGTNFSYNFILNEGNVQIAILGATNTGNQLHNIENGVPTFGDFTATGNVVSGLAPDGTQESNTIVNALGTTSGSSLDVPDWNTLNITGNQPTVIVGGANLNLDGTLNAKQIIIDALAEMTGHGVLNGDLLNEGTVAPGNSPGTLTITGNFTQTSSGTLQIQIASPTVFDQMFVGGIASLAGTLQVQAYGGYQLQYGQQFTFLHAGSITGQFDSITTSDPSVFRARFLTNGGTGTILIAPASYTLVAVTQNQKNAAKALDGFIKATSGDRQTVSIALDLQASAQYPGSLNAIAPTFYESLANITIEQTTTRAQMLAQRSSAVRLGARGFQSIGIEAPLKYDKDGRNVMDAKDGKNIMSPADDNKWGVWVQGNGIFAQAASVNQTPSYNFENGGVLAGADYQWNDIFVTGVYGGYQGTYSKYSNGGVTTINAVDFGLYAGYHSGGFYADAIVGGGSSSYAVRRPIKFSTVDRTATSRPDGGQFTSYLGFGYDWQVGNFTVGPVLSGQYTYAGIAPFTENGAGSLDLAVKQQNANSLRSSLGGRVAYTWKLSDKISLIPEGRLFWQHEFLENSRNIGSSLDGGNGPSFNYTTSAPARDAVFATAGISAQFGPNWTAYLYYNADFGRQDYISHSVNTGLNFKF